MNARYQLIFTESTDNSIAAAERDMVDDMIDMCALNWKRTCSIVTLYRISVEELILLAADRHGTRNR
jgi:hypothetical protein